ncbi:MAG: undecaprenyldiphospho-muramoylpentapeptide beta-N-acetylglucosaminyltransferase [Treponema sp.]|jgi:UDP-N-acetylglucosamine--N-acetylmuramyl-(pentapeptide) pyrophosphoryl-undecaprenol N-acetylglucosamine transferase|nr:undecaprenyldiphospho-muramoylpentapeptide beta-N-acetylglucosaminyltransferase [Treponema sp.]
MVKHAMVTVAFTGGGTGGHIYPGLAVAGALQKNTCCRIIWLGSDKGMDASVVKKGGEGIVFFGVPSGKLRRYASLQNFLDVFKIIAGFFTARKILKKEKPNLLFSKGGFVSVPPVVAAFSLHIPVFTHESDFSPGLATKINSRFSKRIFTAYQDTVSQFPAAYRRMIAVTGNPVRGVFRTADRKRGCAFLGVDDKERILLVLGGSQGAKEINDLVREHLDELTKYYVVVHQTGQAEGDAPASERYKPYRYIDEDMPYVLAAAELVLGRSGAGTVWECAAAGKPMALIPLRGSGTRGDQVENARFFEKAGAAVVVQETERLIGIIAELADDHERRAAMARASLAVGVRDGARIIADIIAAEITGKEAK